MSRDGKIHIVVAETSPVISAGLSFCLCRLPGVQARAIEAHTYPELLDCLSSAHIDIVVVNPTFGGAFDPQQLRHDAGYDIRIVAVAVSQLPQQTLRLYDDAVSVVDDLPTMAAKIRVLVDSGSETDTDREPLSQREKEIITLVVKGLTNKEIADRLFISVHTVMTHRRNIARKLEIHSATGLTIYAIVNRLVDLAEIKI